MNILGIVAEYNPFHNGHKYHISQAIEKTKADAVIAVISGNFVQRGEPAFLEKHVRADLAAANGVDLVLELPVVFSSASAEYFAFGGVHALNSTGLVTHMSFGCETSELDKLDKIALELINESPQFTSCLKEALDSGLSYAKARLSALESVLGFSVKFLSKPNNILAVEYLKALKRLNSSILPCPIKRKGSDYKDSGLDDSLPSSTAIRKFVYDNFYNNNTNNINFSNCIDFAETIDFVDFIDYTYNTKYSKLKKFLPSEIQNIVKNEILSGNIPAKNKLDAHILTLLRTLSPEDIRNLPYVSEGLENRLIKSAAGSVNMEEFFEACNSSRYPDSRINRIVSSLLTGVTSAILDEAKSKGVPYLKVLAFNDKGSGLLKKMGKTAGVPVITKPAALNKLTGYASDVAHIESRATDIFNLNLIEPKPGGLEYKTTPVYFQGLHS